jgi:hypothetical protein
VKKANWSEVVKRPESGFWDELKKYIVTLDEEKYKKD